MSGEIILVPIILGPGLFALLAEGARYLVADKLAPAAKDVCVALWREGHEKAEQEKARLAEWRKFQEDQTQLMNAFHALETAVHASEEKLSSVSLAAPEQQTPQSSSDALTDYLVLKEATSAADAIGKMVGELGATVQGLPAAVRDHEDFPYEKLMKQHKRIATRFERGEKIDLAELDAFRQVVSRTLDTFMQEAAKRNQQQVAFSTRIEAALEQALEYAYLASSPDADELKVVRRQLTDLLSAPQVKLGQLELLEKKLRTIKIEIDRQVVSRAHRTALAESLMRNLVAMGYKKALDFPNDLDQPTLEARMEIPGGECLHISIKPDNQLGFEVVHGLKGGKRKLGKEEMAHFRRQELRWCNDFRQLARQLVAEGFDYRVRLENSLSEDAVKVVVVETPDDILAQEEDERFVEENRKKYLDQ